MARFNAAKIFNAIDKKFQDVYNQLIDLLDTGYIVELTIDGKVIKIELSPKKGLAFYQDGIYRGGLELIDDKLFLTSNAIKGSELDDRYILWEDDPSTYGNPQMQLYDDSTRIGQISFTVDGVSLSSIPKGASDLSRLSIYATQHTANPENFAGMIFYANKGDNNYAQITVYSDVLSGDGHSSSCKFTPVGITATFGSVVFSVHESGVVNIPVMTAYANNAAALAGGLVAGDLYRTGGDPDALCIVH